ncbi:MAG: hypothetical protein RJA81_1054 [Planctomycetota bacterium]|jgi:ribonuclease HI
MSLQPAAEDFVRIYTDGACSGNPGPGGWAFIMEHPASGKRIERAGAEPLTTNNRMEITSALQGLFLLKRPCRVEIITDSQYLAKGIREWLPGWKSNGFRRREGGQFKPLQNEDLWRAVDEELQRHEIQVVHVKGHSGHPENERCDQMAVAAYKRLMAGTLAAANSMNQVVSEIPRTKVNKPGIGQAGGGQISDPGFRRPDPQILDRPAPELTQASESPETLQRSSAVKPAVKSQMQAEKHQAIETSSVSHAESVGDLAEPVTEKIADKPEFELSQTESKTPKRRTTRTKKNVSSTESPAVVRELETPQDSVETAEVPQKVKAVRQRKPKSASTTSSTEQTEVTAGSSRGRKISVVEQPAEAEQPAVKKRAPRKKKAES